MKKAIINVHGNPTLSRIVQELAEESGQWEKRQLTNKRPPFLTFGTIHERALMWSDSESYLRSACADVPWIDAATEFDKVIAFFEQTQRPVIKVGEHTVEWSDDNKTIKVGCTVVPAETVKAIHDELFKK